MLDEVQIRAVNACSLLMDAGPGPCFGRMPTLDRKSRCVRERIRGHLVLLGRKYIVACSAGLPPNGPCFLDGQHLWLAV